MDDRLINHKQGRAFQEKREVKVCGTQREEGVLESEILLPLTRSSRLFILDRVQLVAAL